MLQISPVLRALLPAFSGLTTDIHRWLEAFAIFSNIAGVTTNAGRAELLINYVVGPAAVFVSGLPVQTMQSYTLLRQALVVRFSPT